MQPGILPDFRESLRSVVAVQIRKRAGKILRPAVGAPAAAEQSEVLREIELARPGEIIGDEQVQIAVAVVVEPRIARSMALPQALPYC